MQTNRFSPKQNIRESMGSSSSLSQDKMDLKNKKYLAACRSFFPFFLSSSESSNLVKFAVIIFLRDAIMGLDSSVVLACY